MSAAEEEERAGSASLQQHQTAGRAERRRQLSALEQAIVRAADNAARASTRERKRKRNRRDEEEAAELPQHSAAKQRRSGSPATVCSAEHATFILCFLVSMKRLPLKLTFLLGRNFLMMNTNASVMKKQQTWNCFSSALLLQRNNNIVRIHQLHSSPRFSFALNMQHFFPLFSSFNEVVC